MPVESLYPPQIDLGLKPSQGSDFPLVVDGFTRQTKDPPGLDPCIGSCYESLLNLMGENMAVRQYLQDIYEKRPFTPGHFISLVFRSIQYIELFVKEDHTYRTFTKSVDWDATLDDLLNSERKNQFRELMLTKDTVTTKYQRYAGPRAILSALWPQDQPVNVADFGCGSNYGLRGIEQDEPFEKIDDGTPGKKLTELLSTPLTISRGLAIDKENPDDPKAQAWSLACSFYPKELGQVEYPHHFKRRLRESGNVTFLQADLTAPSTEKIPQNYFHAVIISTLLYQHPPEVRLSIIEKARQALRDDGIIIIQDFAFKDPSSPDGLSFMEPGTNNYCYRTFVSRPPQQDNLLEVFQWSDGRCTTVRAGSDYSRIFDQLNSHS